MDFYRTPLGGRIGEYMAGEDPLLGAVLVPAEINGMQSQEVMSTAKHYVCNDQEFNREFQDVEIAERTLREIYLPPFEGAAKLSRFGRIHGGFCTGQRRLCVRKPLPGSRRVETRLGFSRLHRVGFWRNGQPAEKSKSQMIASASEGLPGARPGTAN